MLTPADGTTMKIPRPDLTPSNLPNPATPSISSSHDAPDGPPVAGPRRGGRPAAAASLAIAALLALLGPRFGERPDSDAATDGIAQAARCDPRIAGALGAWEDCIAGELDRLATDRVAIAGAHFHAWRVADRAARGGARDAAELRERHGRQVRAALRDNLTSLHRLCTAAGEDCERVGEALVPSS
jgi:hypothetical protein